MLKGPVANIPQRVIIFSSHLLCSIPILLFDGLCLLQVDCRIILEACYHVCLFLQFNLAYKNVCLENGISSSF